MKSIFEDCCSFDGRRDDMCPDMINMSFCRAGFLAFWGRLF